MRGLTRFTTGAPQERLRLEIRRSAASEIGLKAMEISSRRFIKTLLFLAVVAALGSIYVGAALALAV